MATRFVRTTRSLAHDGSGRALLAWGLAAVLLAAWGAWFVFGRVTLYEVSRQARLEVQQSAHAVAALVPSRIAANTLVLGQQVQAGDVLVELETGPERHFPKLDCFSFRCPFLDTLRSELLSPPK